VNKRLNGDENSIVRGDRHQQAQHPQSKEKRNNISCAPKRSQGGSQSWRPKTTRLSKRGGEDSDSGDTRVPRPHASAEKMKSEAEDLEKKLGHSGDLLREVDAPNDHETGEMGRGRGGNQTRQEVANSSHFLSKLNKSGSGPGPAFISFY